MSGIVAIIGKPNVGKSTLFNKIIDKRKSIVYDTPGVTRDRLYENALWCGKQFKIIDTGGITTDKNSDFRSLIEFQAQIAIEEANVIVFVLDGRENLTEEDYYIASLLRKANKKILIAVNKLESSENYIDPKIYSLGFKDIFLISAIHGKHLGDLLDEIIKNIPNETKDLHETFKLTLLGKPNVGKSTILNTLSNSNRSIVSDIAGTTRDSVSTFIKIKDQEFEIIDTAGIKRKSKLSDSIEHYSLLRATNSVAEASLCLLILDATEEISLFHQNVIGLAFEQEKPLIIVVNKWDLIETDTDTMDKYKKELQKKLKFVDYAPIVFISALKNKRMDKLRDTILMVKENISRKINTNQLNQLIVTSQLIKPASSINGRRLTIKFAKQVDAKIPTFLLFVNDNKLAHFTYLRYIENQIRSTYNFIGTPIKLVLKNKNKED